MTHSPYAEHWTAARNQAIHHGLHIVEHGWEQHVIIDEDQGVVYRYPRHAAAAAKLEDEVAVLDVIHQQEWSVQLPVMLEHTPTYTSYRYIPGEALTKDWLDSFADEDFARVGGQLGAFLAQLHTLDHDVIDHKKTKQTTTLLEYYTERINGAVGQPVYPPAAQALQCLTISDAPQVVVHGDLHGLNMIIDPASRSLAGVIDVSEMEIGDPHQDFRKLFMAHASLLEPAIAAYGKPIDAERARTWAYVNEWANMCYFADTPDNPTYQRALHHLQLWNQI